MKKLTQVGSKATLIQAITVIDAGEMTLTNTELNKIGILAPSAKSKSKPALYGKNFNTTIFNLVVPALRKSCENLRKIHFGRGGAGYEPFENRSWVVNCYAEPNSGMIGHIEHRYYLTRYMTNRHTTSSLPSPPSVGEDYSSSTRFDLELVYNGHSRYTCCSSHGPHQYNDVWLADLEEGPIFGALYRSIDFGPTPVTLGHLIGLYKRQELAGYAERLEVIIAPTLVPWDIPSFRAFSLTAGAWLTSLTLLNDNDDYRRRENPTSGINFQDLPKLVSIISNHLPKLCELDIGLKGDQRDEVNCLQHLTASALNDGGRIFKLRVFCDIDRSSPFNTIRFLSCLCSSKAAIYIGDGDEAASAGNDLGGPQTRFLRYLRS